MSERVTWVVRDDVLQARLVASIHRMRQQGQTPQVVVSEYRSKRNAEQNRMLHACLQDIADQVTWAGQKWDVTSWKRLLTAGWCRANGTGVQMVPAIDGHGFDVLYQHTSTLTIGECADLITYVLAWAAEQGVRIADPRQAA